MSYRIITPPTAEPMTVGEAMQHCNIDLNDRRHDDWLRRNITSARQQCEEVLDFPLTDAVYEYRVPGFGSSIALPLGYVREVVSIEYYDVDGVVQTLDPALYLLDDNYRRPVIYMAYGQSWPTTRTQYNAVTVRFRGIYSETESPPTYAPEWAKSAMAMMLAHWFANRESVVVGPVSANEIPQTASYLLQPHRLFLGV